MKKIVEEIRDYVQSRWMLGELHGIKHWDRVYENGQKLLTPRVNPLVVELFAYLHDSCRVEDGIDLDHGVRAADWIDTLRNTYLKSVSDEDIELLKEACRLHTTTQMTGNPTIDACFDADRLDLWRVGITPDPDRLATEKGKEIARNTNYEPLIRPWIVDIPEAEDYSDIPSLAEEKQSNKKSRIVKWALLAVALLCFIMMLASCNQVNHSLKRTTTNEADSFSIIYCQPVNGYHVKAIVRKGHSGNNEADISFSKNGKSFTLHTTSFGDTIFNKGGWGMDGTNDELMDKYRGKTIEADYHKSRYEGLTMFQDTPFFFQDLDFDSIEELVIVHHAVAVRCHNGYDVYRIVEGEPVLIDYPPYKTEDEYGMTDYPEFDYENKTISCPYPEGPAGSQYMGHIIYGISKTEKDTVAMNGRYHYFNHLEKIDEKKYTLSTKIRVNDYAVNP